MPADPELTRLRRKRGVIRSAVTKMVTVVETELKPETLNPDVEKLENAVTQFTAWRTEIKDLDDRIELLIDHEGELEQNEEFRLVVKYAEDIIRTKGAASRRLKLLQDQHRLAIFAPSAAGISTNSPSLLQGLSPSTSNIARVESTPPPLVDTSSTTGSSTIGTLANSYVRLPKLEVQKFNGDAEKWLAFWSQYSISVHLDSRLPNQAKFSYLMSYLEGKARVAVSGLPITDANYGAAIQILTERFGNQELIASKHMNILTNLSPVKKEDDIEGLKRLYDTCEVQIRSLQSLGVVTDSYGVLLCHVLTKMLPVKLVIDFNRYKEGKTYKVDDLLTFIRKEISYRDNAYTTNPKNDYECKIPAKPYPINPRHDGRNQKSTRHPSSASALNVSANNGGYIKTCFYCDKPSHKTSECTALTLAERKSVVNAKQRCYICLRKHFTRACDSRIKKCSKCERKHHVTLCDKEENSVSNQETSDTSNEAHSYHVGTKDDKKQMVLLQVAQALAKNPKSERTQNVRCLLDNGSQISVIKQSLSRSLNLPILSEEDFDIYPFEGATPIRTKRRKVLVELINVSEPQKRVKIEAIESPNISGAVFAVPSHDIVTEMKKRGLKLVDSITGRKQDDHASSVDLLIGSDEYWGIVHPNFKRLGPKIVAQDSIFGWVINGPEKVKSSSYGVNTVTLMMAINENVETEENLLSKQVRAFWELDSIGILDADTNSTDGSDVLEFFKKSIELKNGRYEVCFPWKPNKGQLANNIFVATKRTNTVLQKLRNDPVRFLNYNDVMREQLESGVIEKVRNGRAIEDGKAIYYLPHRDVIRELSETTKIRIVFDGSSHASNVPSLNDCLETGPNLNPEIFDVLVRFREGKVAFTADIAKAFLQIAISEEDRDAVRFLWIDVNNLNSKLETYRITRVPFGITSSPFLLSATLRHHIKGYEEAEPKVCEILNKGLYVDDLVSSVDSVKDAYEISKRATEILKEAKMELRKFKTNSSELRELWGSQDPELGTQQTQILASPAHQKVLGLSWETNLDSLTFDMETLVHFLKTKKNTKKCVLSAVARIFDPLGLLAPFTIRAKFLFQVLWQKGLSWDEELPVELALPFESWCAELKDLKTIHIPRFYYLDSGKSKLANIQLHVFVDASEKGYATAAYLRFEAEDGTIGTSLVASKTRVAPLKKLSLPRLELMGAVLGSRLANHLLFTLSLTPSSVRMWTDSTIALQWIKGSVTQWKPFVSNRVRDIQTLTNPESWNHCRSKDNPADLPTRGRTVSDLVTNQFWWKGPTWLSLETEKHPMKISAKAYLDEETRTELRNSFQAVSQTVCLIEPAPEPILDLKKFSSYFLFSVYRITAYIFRFADNCRKKKLAQPLILGNPTTEEIVRAEKFWVKRAQRDSYPKELASLENNQVISKESKLFSLQPILDEDGIICVGGRLISNSLSYRERHPWIIASQHPLSELVAYNRHERLMHSGVNDTLVEVREQFWIPSGRQLIKKVVDHCYHCKWARAQRTVTEMAPLPSFRTTPSPSFEVCGLDFAGPLYTKTGDKCYIALFTCAVTRAIHLELVPDMSTDAFLLAFRRFIARRGIVKSIHSDNAKSFKRAEADLKEILKNIRSPEVCKYFGELKISWYYIVERAAWWGGFWERLVRSVKNCLRSVMGQARLSYDEIHTILTEAEAVINSRPVTYIYQDAGEPTPLTPAHFLVGGRLTALPSRSFAENEPIPTTRQALTKRFKLRQRIVDSFWSRWKKDYLLELRSAHHRVVSDPTSELKIDDVVLIEEPKLPRLCWRMAVVEEAYRGRDGIVRSCLLQLANGTRLKRPVPLLFNLELN